MVLLQTPQGELIILKTFVQLGIANILSYSLEYVRQISRCEYNITLKCFD